MNKVLNRFATIISIWIWLSIFAVDYNLTLFAIIVALLCKFVFLNSSFIENSLQEHIIKKENIKKDNKDVEKVYTSNLEIDNFKKVERVEKKEGRREERRENIIQKEFFEKVNNLENKTENYVSKFFWKIKDFFSTNTLAKLGWILIFFAVVFFLKWLVWAFWEVIWEVGRIILWFIVWLLVFLSGIYLDKKWHKWESEILFWVSLLINYAVILSWRFLVWDNWYLTETTTFLFLILNTVLWIVTSLVYNSRTLLIFSIIWAYLNPFIIWSEPSQTPYTLVWYSMIISLWSLFIAISNNKKSNETWLFYSIFLLWNLLFLVAPFTDSIWFITKLICSSILNVTLIYILNNLKLYSILEKALFWSYISIILMIFNSQTNWSIILENAFLFYNIIIWFFFFLWIRLLKSSNWIKFSLLIPLIIFVFLMIFLWNNFYILEWTIFLFFYLIWAVFLLKNNIGTLFINFYIWGLWVIISLSNFNLVWNIESINLIEYLIILGTSLIFIIFSFVLSKKENLWKLYLIWTIWGIFLLTPLTTLEISKIYIIPAISSLIIFWILNLATPFLNKNLIEKKENLLTLIAWSIWWVLFILFQIHNFGQEFFPWISVWLAFMSLAIIYFLQSFVIVSKLQNSKEKDNNLKNIFYNYAMISLSIFSIAIAIIFSKYPEITWTIWLFEATILFYFYSRNRENKLFIAWNILFIIWLVKLSLLVSIIQEWDFKFLISFSIIFLSLIMNLFFIDKEKNNSIIHHFLHILGIIILTILLSQIIPSTNTWWSLLWISLFLMILWSFYSLLTNSILLKYFFLIILTFFCFYHIWSFEIIKNKLESLNLGNLIILQYLATWLVIWNYLIWKKLNKNRELNIILYLIIGFYSFLITNFYIFNFFENTFSLTIYWGLIASILLIYWIQKDKINLRTLWLYFIILTSTKIFLMDVWQITDTSYRVIAFLVLWIIFVIISTLYTKKYWNNILSELKFNNLITPNEEDIKQDSKKDFSEEIEYNFQKRSLEEIKNEDEKINLLLEKVDDSGIKFVRFNLNNWKKFTIRSRNLIKITKIVINKFKKNNFEGGELNEIYKYVLKHYKSDLTRREFDKIRSDIKDFIDIWGNVELINED